MKVYQSEDNGELYRESEVDVDPATGQAEGYIQKELPDTFTLTAEQVLGGYNDLSNILSREGILKSV